MNKCPNISSIWKRLCKKVCPNLNFTAASSINSERLLAKLILQNNLKRFPLVTKRKIATWIFSGKLHAFVFTQLCLITLLPNIIVVGPIVDLFVVLLLPGFRSPLRLLLCVFTEFCVSLWFITDEVEDNWAGRLCSPTLCDLELCQN